MPKSDPSKKDLQDVYLAISDSGEVSEINKDDLTQADPSYDKAVERIYNQAEGHRSTLVRFYILYITCFTAFVFLLITAQALYRIVSRDKGFEIMPQWCLNLLISGMFVQFIGLLKIVTENVWNFKSFFDHHNEMRRHAKTETDDQV